MTEELSLDEQWLRAPEIKDLFTFLEPEDIETSFQALGKAFTLVSGEKVSALESVFRANGMAEGIVERFDFRNLTGYIKIDGALISFKDKRHFQARQHFSLEKAIGQSVRFNFYPTSSDLPNTQPKNGQAIGLDKLRIAYIYKPESESSFKPNHIEAIGRVAQVWKGGFELWIWSAYMRQHFRVSLAGKGPKEVGSYVRVKGLFECATRLIQVQSYSPLKITPKSELAFDPGALAEMEKAKAALVPLPKTAPTPAPTKSEPATPVVPPAPAAAKASPPVKAPPPVLVPGVVSGKLEIAIKINELPKVRTTPTGWKEFDIAIDDKRIVSVCFRPKHFKKIEDGIAKFPLWVAAISGKLGALTERGFVLEEPSPTVFERKVKPPPKDEAPAKEA